MSRLYRMLDDWAYLDPVLENTRPLSPTLSPSDGAREKMGDLKRFENSIEMQSSSEAVEIRL
jgi:hypothetical protein